MAIAIPEMQIAESNPCDIFTAMLLPNEPKIL